MPFDLQSILAALGMGGGAAGGGSPLPLGAMQGLGGFMTGAGPGGATPASSMGINTGPAQVPTPPPAPSSGSGLASLFGLKPDALGGFGSPSGVGGTGLGGPMSLLGAGASMLNASGPGNAGLGSIIGSGIGGFMQGGQLDRTNALQQQQQAALQRLADQIMKLPSGAQPAASQTSPTGAPAATPASGPPMITAPRPAPQVPGAPPVPGPGAMGGGMPLGGGQQQPNPFIQMMLQKRYGRPI